MKTQVKNLLLPLALALPFAFGGFVSTPAFSADQDRSHEIQEGDDGNGSLIDERDDDDGYGEGIDTTGSSGGG